MNKFLLEFKRFKAWSLRSRLVLTVLLLSTVALFISSFASYKFIESFLSLRGEEEVYSLLNGPYSPVTLSESEGGLLLAEPNPGVYVAVLNQNGKIISSAGGNVGGSVVPPILDGINQEFVNEKAGIIFETFSADKSNSFRTAAKVFPNGTGFALVAVNKTSTDQELQKVLLLSISVSLAILLLLIITARYAINLALKPLLSFVDVASSFSGGRRDSRWDVKTSSGEVEVLGKSFNQMLDTVNESIDQKEEYAESLKRFIADASHELKTPLTVIQGFSEMLSKDMINDKAKKKSAYQRVERESRRMSRLVEDLLTLAKLDQGSSITFSKEEIDPIIKEVLENATISAKGHRFAFNSKTQDISLNVDKNSIHRLLSNLVSNAYKYSPDNSLIEIKTIVTDNFLEIYISDEGIGIPANERVLVFERFYKTKDNPLSNNSKLEKEIESSTGLGLAIAKSIAQKHGGDLECITPLLSGATFKLTLPIS